MRPSVGSAHLLALLIGGLLLGCGHGNGISPTAIEKQEDGLLQKLDVSWDEYNAGGLENAVEYFTQVLDRADKLESPPAVINGIKSEAHNGLGWTAFRQHDLREAADRFLGATNLNRRNTDAWVGWAGVALAQGHYSDAVRFCLTALADGGDGETPYSSAARLDEEGRELGHDTVTSRHVRLMLAEAYFHQGYYSSADRPGVSDATLNASGQVALLRDGFTYTNPIDLIRTIGMVAAELQVDVTWGN
jgi:tetratricopeptide (TPR) repeat protein